MKKTITSVLICAALSALGVELPSKAIIAHAMPQFGAGNKQIAGCRDYYAYAPSFDSFGNLLWPGLAVPAGISNQGAWVDMTLARQAGVSGFNLDLFYQAGNEKLFGQMLDVAAYMNGQGQAFSVSPCLDFTGKSPTAQNAVDWVNSLLAYPNKSAWATKNGKYVVWCYNGSGLGLTFWKTVASALPSVRFYIDDLKIVQTGALDADIDAWSAICQLYSFRPDVIWGRTQKIQQRLKAQGKPTCGGVIPGYWRQVTNTDGTIKNNVTNSQGFTQLDLNLNYWQSFGVDMIQVTTWNDLMETSGIEPSVIWGDSRRQRLRDWAAVWRG